MTNPQSYHYLASPYTHDDQSVVERRVSQAMEYTADQLNQGIYVYSPIVHCHELATLHSLPTDADFWWGFNSTMIRSCKELIVLQLDDWLKSKGVKQEINYAEFLGIPVRHATPLS